MQPEITFIIPVFNKEAYLRQCVNSVIEQSFSATEIICINDGSTDCSAMILNNVKEVDSRVRLIENGRNLGAAHSRNKGIAEARGRFIRFVDADDLLPANSTELLYRRAIETESELVRGSLALFQLEDCRKFESVIAVADRWRTTFKAEPSLWIPYWHTSYLFSARLIRDNGIVYPALSRGEDPVFLASVLVRAQWISLVPDVVYLYRKYPKTTGSGATTIVNVKDTLVHAATIKSLYTHYHPECWYSGYGPFLMSDFLNFIKLCRLDDFEMEFVNSEARKIWGTEIHLP